MIDEQRHRSTLKTIVTCVTMPYVTCVTVPYVTCVTVPYVICVTAPYVTCVTVSYVICVTMPYVTYVTVPYVTCVFVPYVICMTVSYVTFVTVPYATCVTVLYVTCVSVPAWLVWLCLRHLCDCFDVTGVIVPTWLVWLRLRDLCDCVYVTCMSVLTWLACVCVCVCLCLGDLHDCAYVSVSKCLAWLYLRDMCDCAYVTCVTVSTWLAWLCVRDLRDFAYVTCATRLCIRDLCHSAYANVPALPMRDRAHVTCETATTQRTRLCLRDPRDYVTVLAWLRPLRDMFDCAFVTAGLPYVIAGLRDLVIAGLRDCAYVTAAVLDEARVTGCLCTWLRSWVRLRISGRRSDLDDADASTAPTRRRPPSQKGAQLSHFSSSAPRGPPWRAKSINHLRRRPDHPAAREPPPTATPQFASVVNQPLDVLSFRLSHLYSVFTVNCFCLKRSPSGAVRSPHSSKLT